MSKDKWEYNTYLGGKSNLLSIKDKVILIIRLKGIWNVGPHNSTRLNFIGIMELTIRLKILKSG